jgi:addiction module HigA family antidote
MPELLDPISPGEILSEEFLKPLGISQSQMSRDVDIPASRISQIVNGSRAITADTALRLAEYLGTSAEMWMNLQAGYDLRVARQTKWPQIKQRIRKFNRAQ